MIGHWLRASLILGANAENWTLFARAVRINAFGQAAEFNLPLLQRFPGFNEIRKGRSPGDLNARDYMHRLVARTPKLHSVRAPRSLPRFSLVSPGNVCPALLAHAFGKGWPV